MRGEEIVYIPTTGGVDLSLGGAEERNYCGHDSIDFFRSGEILEFEDTVVADIFSYEHIGSMTLTPPTPADLESSIIWLNSCNYMYNIAT